MLTRQLHYLTTLARERHFARAAEACNVTQPTLSAAIKQLEETLGVLLVERGHRFVGMTEEGELVLAWAQRTLSDFDALEQELAALKEGLIGKLRIGAIPVMLPIIDRLVAPFAEAHPRTTTRVMAMTSVEIQRGLEDFELDVGVTYLDNEPLGRVRTLALYEEEYRLLTPARGPFAGRETATWAEAAALPLSLLTEDMQNRRILDMHFGEAGAVVRPVFETDSPLALLSLLRGGQCSTVLPQTHLPLLGTLDGLDVLMLVEPLARHKVGLVASRRDPLSPLAKAMLDCAQTAGSLSFEA